MSTEITIVRFKPEDGAFVDLPEDVGRSKIERGPKAAAGRTHIAVVVGRGETERHVLLSTTNDSVELPDGSKVIGVQVPESSHATPRLVYAVPDSAYWGN